MENFSYNKRHCYQYDIRLKNFEYDLDEAELTEEETQNLKVSDFKFEFVLKENKVLCSEVRQFIERHEWLGKMPTRPTHRFIATYKGRIAGAIIMATPNSFSNLLGAENRHLEKLISRGACISWSPKNLGSAIVMFAVRWMVKNTEFRYFTAYSDVEARELGTIYQACNFNYLGQNAGGRVEYFDPSNPKRGWFSDRLLRKASAFKKHASNINVEWQSHWSKRDKLFWDLIPVELRTELQNEAALYQNSCEMRTLIKKHKYVYILGRSKSETKKLRNLFNFQNPKKLPYPKLRGPTAEPQNSTKQRPTKIAATEFKNSAATSYNQSLTENSWECRPQMNSQFLTIKEASIMFNISDWTLYQFIKTDPTFPYLNMGIKKKFLVDSNKFQSWAQNRSKSHRNSQFNLRDGFTLFERSAR